MSGRFQRLEMKCVQYLFPDCRRYGKIISQLTEIKVILAQIRPQGAMLRTNGPNGRIECNYPVLERP